MAMASGVFGLTLEKFFIDTLGDSLEAEDNNGLLVTDTYTPNFDTHDFRADVTNEVPNGSGYTTGGKAYTSTEITLASGVLTYDAADMSWTSSTITARGVILYRTTGSSATDELFMALTFGSDIASSSGTFTIAWNVSGIMTIDYTP